MIQYSGVKGGNMEFEMVVNMAGILLTRKDRKRNIVWWGSFRYIAFASKSNEVVMRSIVRVEMSPCL